jgi:hypothetical protein
MKNEMIAEDGQWNPLDKLVFGVLWFGLIWLGL